MFAFPYAVILKGVEIAYRILQELLNWPFHCHSHYSTFALT